MPIDTHLNQAFSLNELLSAINDTKNTATGPDNICYEMFKHLSVKSLEVMLQLFNKIWLTGKNSSILAALHCRPHSITNLRTYRLPTAQYP